MQATCLFNPVEQAGYLFKKGHSTHSWRERYFVLKGTFLFYFKERKAAQKGKMYGVIPLESAKIETELPPALADSSRKEGHVITITLHSTHAFSCMHPFYVLSAPTQEVQMAWVNAMWQAAIPRADLIQHLQTAGKLADVVAGYMQTVQANFPTADAAVLSTGGRARTAALANVGSLPAMIRKQKQAPEVTDLQQLPVVISDKPAPSHVLARTASGNVVTAPSTSVVRPDVAAAVGIVKPSPKPPAPTSKTPAAAAVTVTATAGGPAPSATKTTASGGSGSAVQSPRAKDPQQELADKAKEIEAKIAELSKQASIEIGKGKR